MDIRRAESGDAPVLAALVKEYLRERHPDHPGVSAAELRRDVLKGESSHRVLLADRRGETIGFVAWDAVYDMHWAASGAQVADLYVVPEFRGHGVALMLLCALCAEARAEGASFVRGSSFDRNSPTGQFYERIGVVFDSAECHCGGRAFRQLADLHGSPVRALIDALPPPEWNFSA
jgi:GNAT superfamily N-acetyltransferase